MADTIERTYNVPLRREYLKSPLYKRSKKAVTALRQFISKHMKSDNVKISKDVNDLVWKHGIKNPPHHIKVDVVKDNEGLVNVYLEGKKPKAEVKKGKKKTEKNKVPKVEAKATAVKPVEKKVETKKTNVKDEKKEVKPVEKEEESKKVEEKKAVIKKTEEKIEEKPSPQTKSKEPVEKKEAEPAGKKE